MMIDEIIPGQMDMAHAVAIHVQTEPDTEYTLHINVILMDEISPFL